MRRDVADPKLKTHKQLEGHCLQVYNKLKLDHTPSISMPEPESAGLLNQTCLWAIAAQGGFDAAR